MPQRADSSHSRGGPSAVDGKPSFTELAPKRSSRSAFLWLALFVLLINGSWAIYYFQFENLPTPLSTKEAGKRGFSEISALEHVKYLTGLGPHPVGSDPLDLAVQYVLAASEEIKKAAHWEVDVQVELFHAETGANRLNGGLFKGKTLIYSDLKHVVLRILPKYLLEARENAILVSSHIDTVFSTQGAGDCSSCVGVMLELARGISQWAHGFKSGVIFLFNTGEEEGLNGAHSFITQHPWARTVRFVVDLEAMGIGGKSIIFQSNSAPWAIESYAKVATYPSGQIIAQDFFLSGAIKSATDFQVYKEVAGLPGLDFAYLDASAVYHTKNDKLKLLKPGSLQHLGENMLAFLRRTAVSPHLHEDAVETGEGTAAIFFDVLGMYMVAYRQRLASMVQNSVILQAVLIWTTSLLMGGYPGVKSLGLSCLSIIFMWVFSLILSVLVAFLLPHLSSSPIPYIANPWLLIGLFGAPSVLGALSGQHIGFILLQKYLQQSYSKRATTNLPPNVQANLVNWEAERWLFKSGFVQSFFLLIAGNFFKIGSSYLALVWLVSPAFAYGLMEATLSPARAPRQLKITTLIMGLVIPFILSAGLVIQFAGTITANLVRFDRNPGSTPEWLGNVIVSVFIAAVVCLTLVYPLSYVHLSGSKRSIIFSICAILGLTVIAISTGVAPSFTEDIARTVNVVHVVKTAERPSEHQKPLSFVSIFSGTPGKLTAEMKNLNDEEFNCGRNETLDFVTFTVKYGCWTTKDSGHGWSESEIPLLHVESESSTNIRKTRVFVDTKHSTRWALAINTQEIRDFTFEVNSEELVPEGDKKSVDGWHIIQFSGGRNSPTKFHLNLTWLRNATDPVRKSYRKDEDPPLLKLRTDVNRVTPVTARILEKLPAWCSLFGKSTGPYTLAFLTSLPVNF